MTTTPSTHAAQLRITRLATLLPVHRAFHWLHLHQLQLRQWQLEFLAIPAPPFGEAPRAAWFLAKFRSFGLQNCHIDPEGNAIGELQPETPLPDQKYLLISAHLDTVFPATAPTQPRECPDTPRILGPGSCDNGAGLTALLALIAALRHAQIAPPIPILFCANVGEEGEGDLRGMRYLFERGPYANRIATAIALEGSGTASAVIRALGSRRFRVTISGPGGHSWTDAAIPNPITLISRAIAQIAALPSLTPHAHPGETRTTFSPGLISGGTSINSIPQSATVQLDLRSTDPAELLRHSGLIEQILTQTTAEASQTVAMHLEITPIGDRPAATLPLDSPLLDTLRAVDRHLNLRTELRLGSTDANIPLALGIPAAALAAGGTGSGIHTLAEWFDPTGRETALRRLLLTLLDLAQTIHAT